MLLRRGATSVIALDVGHGQLDWRLRTDPRVIVLEHVNARFLEPTDLQGRVDVVTIDVSFISLRHILPVVPPILTVQADVVALVKPQFEAGREEVARGGIVRDPDVWRRALEAVGATAAQLGLGPHRSIRSPITGADGNVEFLVEFRAGHVEPVSLAFTDSVVDAIQQPESRREA